MQVCPSCDTGCVLLLLRGQWALFVTSKNDDTPFLTSALQSGLFVGGAIGVLFFHELRGREQIGYWLSGIVLIAGVTMLAFSK